MQEVISRKLQAALMRIRGDHPFFGTLALFAEIRQRDDMPTACTDGKVLWFNPKFVERLGAPQLCGLVVHELLHAALQHVPRRKERDAELWNIAADIVVNEMIRHDTLYELPDGGVEEPTLAHLSVEEIYEQLQSGRTTVKTIQLLDLLPGILAGGGVDDATRGELQRHWQAGLQQAASVARRMDRGFGRQGLDMQREFDAATVARLSWRELLWQFMVATPFDFAGFDRRFIHRRLYLEGIEGESTQVAVCVDTSGSIAGPELDSFMAEVRGILEAYPQIQCQLFYADAALYGPYEITGDAPMPAAVGGGGTSFVPFFDWVRQQEADGVEQVSIYLTDGFGEFPTVTPRGAAMWVVSPGGLESGQFPFGETVRMGA